MKKFTKIKKIITALIVSVAVFFSGQVFLPANFSHVKAAEVNNFDASLVIQDLSHIDITKYPADKEGKPYIISFMEYCYSEKFSMAENYGLYVYLYNPTEQEINTSSVEINMAIDYNEKGEPSSYDNLSLIFLNKTENNRFYKFKVTDRISFLTLQKKYMIKFFCRRYDVNGIQFKYFNENLINADDFPVKRTFIYKGYSKGCGSDNKSNLVCEVKNLEVVEPRVGHTNYRFDPKLTYISRPPETVDALVGYPNLNVYESRDELNSVYFSVSNTLEEKYGGLQKVKSEWYEYKTTPIFVTSHEGAKKYFLDEILKNSPQDGNNWQIFWDIEYSPLGEIVNGFPSYTARKSFNYQGRSDRLSNYINLGEFFALYELKSMNYIFHDDISSDSDFKISRTEMFEWMKNYIGNIVPEDKVSSNDIILEKYHKDLFFESIDEDRINFLEAYKNGNTKAKSGYMCQEVDAGENGFIDSRHYESWWKKILGWKDLYSIPYSPIQKVTLDKLEALSVDEFCRDYYVNRDDYEDISKAIKTANEKNESFYLVRFAVTDYYTSHAIFDEYDENFLGNNHVGSEFLMHNSYNGYVAQETVFLDFDIISLTFRKDGVDTVIGVVSDPFDIINGLEPPLSLTEENWLMKILAIVALILVLVVIGPFLSPILTIAFNLLGKLIAVLLKALALIFKFIWSILTFPFRLLKPK